jgi:hypothetical protein
MIPGNLLNRAMGLCGSTTIQWYSATGTTINDIGLRVTTFALPVSVIASVQPVPRSLVQFLGLDAQKEYVNVYASTKMDDLARDRSGDQFVFGDYRYQIMSNTEWFRVNGWNGTLAVKIGPAPT